MLTRAITGAVFLVVMVGAILWDYYSLFILFSLIVAFGFIEIYYLLKNKLKGLSMPLLLICGLTSFFSLQFASYDLNKLWFLIFFHSSIYLVTLLFDLFRQNYLFSNTIVLVTFSLVFSAPFNLLLKLVSSPHAITNDSVYTYEIVLGFFILLWTNDTFAYLTGKYLGKHKLWEKVSPKKTWEGFIGGLAFSILSGYMLSLIFNYDPIPLKTNDWIIISILISVFGTLGDLSESMFKRNLGVKDSGNLLPGHGGILDRFDGVLLAAPIVFIYIFSIPYFR